MHQPFVGSSRQSARSHIFDSEEEFRSNRTSTRILQLGTGGHPTGPFLGLVHCSQPQTATIDKSVFYIRRKPRSNCTTLTNSLDCIPDFVTCSTTQIPQLCAKLRQRESTWKSHGPEANRLSMNFVWSLNGGGLGERDKRARFTQYLLIDRFNQHTAVYFHLHLTSQKGKSL